MEVRQVLPCLFQQAILRAVKHFLILRDDDALVDSEVRQRMVVDDWLVVRIADHSHHRLKKGLTCAQVPVLKAWDQVDIEVALLVEHVHDLISGSCYSSDMLGLQGVEDLIHSYLIVVHRAADPHVIVLSGNGVLGRERRQGGDPLNTVQLPGELVFDEYAALGRAEVRATLPQRLLVERLVNDANSRPSIDSDTDHGRDMVEMTLGEAPSAVQGVDPHHQLLLEELVWKLVVVVVSLWGCHAVDLLHLL